MFEKDEDTNELSYYQDFEPKIHELHEFLSDEVKSTHEVDLTEFDLKSYLLTSSNQQT